ncbi:MAG: hypothetical protein QOE65_2217 [Solirubrobacteraceae bacterium]|jgi:hypothetical protein|nr:hypothetical protein [Solirubrobacteraceae bacterium]
MTSADSNGLPDWLGDDVRFAREAPAGFVALPGRPGVWVREAALATLLACMLEERDAMRAEVGEVVERLPVLAADHATALRRGLGRRAPGPDADVHDHLRDRVALLDLERRSLLVDRQTSLRALSWTVRTRVPMWLRPRLGILWQHAPVPVRLPRRYTLARPPRAAPKISIVTPSLNQGEFIGDTLASVLDQGYPNVEYVVQDGGSTDSTAEVLERHRHRLHHVHSGPDDGQADAINRGFARTSGEIMAYLNADDVLLPGALATVARHFQAHPDVDAVYGQRILVDDANRQVGIWVTPAHDDEMLVWSDCVPQETLFWRRSAWERVGAGLDESFHFAMDWDLLLRMRDAGVRFHRIPRFLGAFRVHAAQKTTAMEDVGLAESAMLLERVHGRPVAWEECWRRLRGYFRRHVALHTAHRVAARLPAPRFTPAWLRPR